MIEPSFPQFYVFGIIALYYFRTNDPVHFPNLQMTMVRRGAWARVTIDRCRHLSLTCSGVEV
jgi:hypothetical protein